ncbi:MAG: GAF domain-containing protein [Candidatus Eiseniibacteriota bacterium]
MSTRQRSARAAAYQEVLERIDLLLEGETDWIAAMATVVCELKQGLDHYDWVGFYRAVGEALLVIGPYQGTHGCLRIAFGKGVCGAAAATRRTVVVDDVREFPGHIACDERSLSEIVVPVLRPDGTVLAVLDVDSNRPADFRDDDREALETLCGRLGQRFGA